LAHLFRQKIPFYDESVTLDFVFSPKNKTKKKKSTDKPPYYREFQNSKILAHLFPQKIPFYDDSVTLDFVLSPKKEKKKC
jgi:hypothetical protein